MRALLAAVLSLSLTGAAHAQALETSLLKVHGQVRRPATLSVDQLRAMPGATVQWSTRGPDGVKSAFFEGPLLWEILRAVEPIDLPGQDGAGRSHLQHVVIARGADGYAVAIAMGEVDPEFEGKKVLVSLPRDGQPTLQLAVPNDARAGRGVHDLVELEIR